MENLLSYTVEPQHLVAGKFRFTITNPKGDHFTFQVKSKSYEGRAPWHFVSWLHQEEVGDGSWTYLGAYQPDRAQLKATRASRSDLISGKAWKVFEFCAQVVAKARQLPEGYALQASKHCARCGIELTHPESLEHGYGPECFKKISRQAA